MNVEIFRDALMKKRSELLGGSATKPLGPWTAHVTTLASSMTGFGAVLRLLVWHRSDRAGTARNQAGMDRPRLEGERI